MINRLVSPTIYCFMVLFVTLTLYEVFSKLLEATASISMGIMQ